MHRKPKLIPAMALVRHVLIMAVLAALAVSLVLMAFATATQANAKPAPSWQAQSASMLAHDAATVCHPIGAHECVTAPRNHARVTVPDNGVQPLCPRFERGWTVTFHVRGTHFNFPAECVPAGPHVSVWDALPKR